MKIKLVLSTFLMSSLFCAPVMALGLGDIELKSRLNERFEAQIPLVVKADADAEDLVVKLANNENFERAGLKKTAAILDLRFKPVRISESEMVIQVSSKSHVKEPMMAFVLEVEHRGTRSLRQYTAFMETPSR